MKTPLAADDPRHGTHCGYSNHDCRCLPCWRAEKRYRLFGHEVPHYDHGGRKGYDRWLVKKGIVP